MRRLVEAFPEVRYGTVTPFYKNCYTCIFRLQGSHLKDKKKKKDKKSSKNDAVKNEIQVKNSPAPVQLLSMDEDCKLSNPNVADDEDDKEDPSEILTTVDVDTLNSLTGQPFPEDVLLFAVPVVAPYNAIINYK